MPPPLPVQPTSSAPSEVPQGLRAFTIKILRRDRSWAPGGDSYDQLLKVLLPLVYGSARAMLPENPALTETATSAVFESFAFRWRRLSNNTLIATWLLRTTWFAVLRERRRLGLGKPERGSTAEAYQILFKRVFRLRPKTLNPVVLRHVLNEPADVVASALRLKEPSVEKYARVGLQRLEKVLRRKRVTGDAHNLLQTIPAPVPEEITSRLVNELSEWSPQQRKSELSRRILRNWRWLGFRRAFKQAAMTLGTVVCLLVALGITANWVIQRGFFTAWFIRQGSKQMLKEFPEVAIPARTWPVSAEDRALVSQQLPKSAAELYQLTNIWISKLTFSAEQWAGIQPVSVPPVPRLMERGRINLRNPKAKRSGLSGALGIDFNYVEAGFEFAGVQFERVATRYRGNGTFVNSLYGPKQSFKVDLNKFTKKQSIGGMNTLNFLNTVVDNSYLHDALAQRLFRELGVPAPRTAFAYLTIDVPGKFTNQALGLYGMVENIDKDFAGDRFGDRKTPIFKPVTYDLFQDLGSNWNAYADIYDVKTETTPKQQQRVIDFARLVTEAEDDEFERRLPEFLDLEVFAGFLAGHVLLSSYDGFLANGQNFYVYLDPRSNKFGFIPWDQDHAWGDFGHIGTTEQREHASIWRPSLYNNNRFLERVMKTEVFRSQYRRKLETALAEVFTVDRLYAWVDETAAIIRPAVASESDFRLRRFDQAVSSTWLPGSRDGAAEGPKAPVHQIKRFIENRIKSVRDQLDGKSEGMRPQFGRNR